MYTSWNYRYLDRPATVTHVDTRKADVDYLLNVGEASTNRKVKSRRRKRCQYDGCTKSPSFNYDGIKVAKYCNAHKEPGMINVTRRLCRLCTVSASFNYPNKTRSEYCARHSRSGMINMITHPRCKYGRGRAADDTERYLDDNCIIPVSVRPVSILRLTEPCSNMASFGDTMTRKREYCIAHKQQYMVNVLFVPSMDMTVSAT